MKKVLILLVALLTVPAMAASNVTISCADDDVDTVTVSYATDPNLIRGFGLDLTVDNGRIITGVTIIDPNYRIYPGQIVIVDGNVTDYNTPYAPGSLDCNVVTVELASLYTFDANYISDSNYGYGMQPNMSGDLLSFTVSGDCNYTVTENATRGGVVMENPDEVPNVTLCGGDIPPECYAGMADYAEWADAGKPDCWCYPRQCHGDADGLKVGSPFTGYYYVSQADLNILISAWQVKNPPQGPGLSGNQGCADFDRAKVGSPFTGYYRVSQDDLNILISTWQVKESPQGPGVPGDCLPGNRTP